MRLIDRLRAHVVAGRVRVTLHASYEMAAEQVLASDLVAAFMDGDVIEEYPDDPRGPSCLVSGMHGTRPIHVVCTIGKPPIAIITAYEPKPPRWVTPTRRGQP